MKLNSHWKSRKLWMYITVMLGGTGIWYLAEASIFTDWVEMTKWLTGIYMSGNGIEHIGKAMNGQKNEPSAEAQSH
jgi:hypothetical protein